MTTPLFSDGNQLSAVGDVGSWEHGGETLNRGVWTTPGGPDSGPRVFVVTPSFNQGPFLRETIESVLAQDYPEVDYFVADGGSSDESVEILESYGERLRWVSAPDGGQSAAIAAAWKASDADVVAWLNSDDVYEPGAISRAVDYLLAHPEVSVVYGKAWYIDRDGRKTGSYPTRPFDRDELFHTCFVCQPATFLRRNVLTVEEPPDPALRYCMDYDLWIRLARHFRFGYLEEFLAQARMYSENKTLGERSQFFRELAVMTRRRFGITSRNWSVASVLYENEKRMGRLPRFVPESWRRRLEALLTRRGEARLVGPLYADGWAGSRTRVEVEGDAEGWVSLVCQAPFWPYRRPLQIRAVYAGQTLAATVVEEEHFTIELRISEAAGRRRPLLLVAGDTFIPQDWDFSPDPRPLSFLVRAIEQGRSPGRAAC